MGLVGGTPTFMPIEGFTAPDVPARTYHYSPDGRLFAYTLPSACVIA
jgi:translation initiation factor 2A